MDEIPSKIARRKDGETLSIVEQVQCLIDIATDKHLLGILYVGYTPWF